jgi:hypothetical protein
VIPRRIIRTVPEHTTAEVDGFWAHTQELHPGWEFLDLRDPIDPALFPLTAGHWDQCLNGAQRAGLIRLEALWTWGGIYLDSDVELYRRLDPLIGLEAFATWESPWSLNDAVLGSRPGHPAFLECIELAIERLPLGALHSGPKVAQDTLRDRSDVLCLPPVCFSPYLWNEKHRRGEDHATAHPYCFGAHHWHNSHNA